MTLQSQGKSIGQELYDELVNPKNGTKKTTAKAFKELLNHLDEDKPISQYKLNKFKKSGILQDGKITMDDPTCMLEWNLMCACYEGLMEMRVN